MQITTCDQCHRVIPNNSLKLTLTLDGFSAHGTTSQTQSFQIDVCMACNNGVYDYYRSILIQSINDWKKRS